MSREKVHRRDEDPSADYVKGGGGVKLDYRPVFNANCTIDSKKALYDTTPLSA